MRRLARAPALALALLLAAPGAAPLPAGALSLRSTSGPAGPPREGSPSVKVLYLLRTWHRMYGTRLPAILKTWAAPLLRSGALLVVGDEPSNETSIHVADECNYDGASLSEVSSFAHNLGLCCKTAEAVVHALRERPRWDWLFVADDDAYVITENMEKVLAHYDPAKPVALGAVGCLLENCTGPGENLEARFCGGGGYALSRGAVSMLVGDSVEGFKKHHHNISTEFKGEEDVATSCMLRRNRIPMFNIQGLYPFRLAPPHNDANGDQAPFVDHLEPEMLAPLDRSTIPLVFHYLSPAEIEAYHQEIAAGRGVGGVVTPDQFEQDVNGTLWGFEDE